MVIPIPTTRDAFIATPLVANSLTHPATSAGFAAVVIPIPTTRDAFIATPLVENSLTHPATSARVGLQPGYQLAGGCGRA